MKKKPGSIKSQAFLDRARSEYLEDRINRSTKEPGRIPQIEIDQYIAEQAAVNETIRVRKFGENGTEYNNAFEDSDSLWIYRDYCKAQVPPNSEYEPSFYSYAAIMTIEKDMLSINAIKNLKDSNTK